MPIMTATTTAVESTAKAEPSSPQVGISNEVMRNMSKVILLKVN